MILKNKKIQVCINTFGAEVKSIIKNEVEYLWQGDPTYWKRSSPVLFPIVGRLIDDEYYLNEKTYNMTQHGFARDNEFTLIESTDVKAVYLLTENEQTLKKYPFNFNLYIEYVLSENELIVLWKVENTNKDLMYFQIGAHPAFNFLNGSIIEINKNTNRYELQGNPYINAVVNDVEVKSIIVDDTTFLNDALVYEGIDKVRIRDNKKMVDIESTDFPFFGIWSSVKNGVNAPFVCLEPWHGITDFMTHDKKLENKKGMKVLKPNEAFEASYRIILN